MSFIGIDLGGTFIKGAILDADSIQLRHVRRIPFPDFEPGAAFERVISPEKVLTAFRTLLEELLVLDPECEGLFMCGQMHALVFCDSVGNPHSEIITWQDQRTGQPFGDSGESCFEILKGTLKDWDLRTLGNEFRPGLPLTQLFQIKQMGVLPDNLYPACLMDFVISNFCKTVPVTDATNAEAHGLFNIVEGNWDAHLIHQSGFHKLHWPEVKPHFTVSGTFKYNEHEIPCYVAIGDQQAALLGSLLAPRELSLNIATGSQVGLLYNVCELGEYQTRPYLDGQYLKTITHIPAGRALNVLIHLFTEIPRARMDVDEVWNYIHGEVEKKLGTNLDVSITYYGGPLGNTGHISNMHEGNMTLGDVFSAAFRGMAENYHQCALRLSPGCEWDRIVFSGGLVSKMPALQGMILGKFGGMHHRMNEGKEDALTGLLIMAMKTRHPTNTLAELTDQLRIGHNN